MNLKCFVVKYYRSVFLIENMSNLKMLFTRNALSTGIVFYKRNTDFVLKQEQHAQKVRISYGWILGGGCFFYVHLVKRIYITCTSVVFV